MGVAINAHKSLPLLYQDVADEKMDVILHIGDLAYDLQSQNGASGDAFVVETEPLASRIPIHYCPGNHVSVTFLSLNLPLSTSFFANFSSSTYSLSLFIFLGGLL
jgi:hypothetical protein